MKLKVLIFLVCLSFFPTWLNSQTKSPDLGDKAFELLNIPNLTGEESSGQIVIAVIDDAFLLNHKATSGFYYQNEDEIPDNGVDDDLNGYVDDAIGWDVADADHDVMVSDNTKMEFYHGTMVSSIISQVATRSYGENAHKVIKILPIKALSDHSQNTSMQDGYKGLKYAIESDVDIICMAWNGGTIKSEFADLLNQAQQKGILLLASAGNFSSNFIKPPASHKSVYCVAAVDSNLIKTTASNYGLEVDICASGDRVRAGHSDADNAFFTSFGTSAAVALITGGAAIIKHKFPDASPMDIMEAIKNTSKPIESKNRSYNGLLGAGFPDFTNALAYLEKDAKKGQFFNSERPEGNFILSREENLSSYKFHSSTGTDRMTFKLTSKKSKVKSEVVFYSNDTIYKSFPLVDLPYEITIPGNNIRIEMPTKLPKNALKYRYTTTPIDSAFMYCRESVYITEESGEISDGSGDHDYTNRVSCQWVITTSEEKRIKLDFTEFNTQTDIDFVWIFHYNKALKENLIAKFSGDQLPPIIVTGTNQVLVWFVTNDKVTADGWLLNYSSVDDQPGIFHRATDTDH